MKNKYISPHIKMPSGRRIVVGDIHGCFYSLKALIETKVQLNTSDQLFLLGDYINRGKHSAKVLDYLISLVDNGYQIYPLRGNHEQMLLQAYGSGIDFFEDFLEHHNSVDLLNDRTDNYLNFCVQLDYGMFTQGFFLSHSGIFSQGENWMVDVRNMFSEVEIILNEKEVIENCTIVHGHNTVALASIVESVETKANEVNLDAGCVYTHQAGLGYLCALDLDEFILHKQKNID